MRSQARISAGSRERVGVVAIVERLVRFEELKCQRQKENTWCSVYTKEGNIAQRLVSVVSECTLPIMELYRNVTEMSDGYGLISLPLMALDVAQQQT